MNDKHNALYYVALSEAPRDGRWGSRATCTEWYIAERRIEMTVNLRVSGTWRVVASTPYQTDPMLGASKAFPYTFDVSARSLPDAHLAAVEALAGDILFYDSGTPWRSDHDVIAGRAECALLLFLPWGAIRALYLRGHGNFEHHEEVMQDVDVEHWWRNSYIEPGAALAMFLHEPGNTGRLGPDQLQQLEHQVASSLDPVLML